ncbi:ATP-grasp domain-containing protein [Ramlibacter sp. USB13]|uniref:ATP-grasp domain-containing protein n=1 Tax=Ramlibacter cellulosilyticus TaxID=2764187 RepID=A0A923MP32_9BURK|nr:ATP-grasp domain-containing protein [Ramlibacter cellulosilyticus]MBC5782221.1 ATP-grasp domain-containing protein [Ramlibacter cellulosilyticus]
MRGSLVVAGLWVRPLAESATRAGWRVVALDLFGDADTWRACARWERIGDPAAFAIAPGLLRGALERASREPGVLGWVAGSGFEGMPEALDQRIAGLPLLGMAGEAMRRVRAPASFFGKLDRLGLEHPAIAFQSPADPAGWLAKDAGASGGWHIRAAEDDARTTGVYWQRFQPGVPMSVLFLADGAHARVVALNRLLVRPLGDAPFVYHGAIGPVRDAVLARRMEAILALLVPVFGLRGLASLDFIAHGQHAWLLEVNPRPSATMVLHDAAWPAGLVDAHVRAVQGWLPPGPPAHAGGVRGNLIVFADRACRVGAALAADLARSTHCHDLPVAGATFAPGEPVCSVSACGSDQDAVVRELDARAAGVRARLAQEEELAA